MCSLIAKGWPFRALKERKKERRVQYKILCYLGRLRVEGTKKGWWYRDRQANLSMIWVGKLTHRQEDSLPASSCVEVENSHQAPTFRPRAISTEEPAWELPWGLGTPFFFFVFALIDWPVGLVNQLQLWAEQCCVVIECSSDSQASCNTAGSPLC